MLDPYAPYGGQNSAYPPSSLYSSSSSTPLPPMTPAVAPTAAGANLAHHAMSPLSDPDADASTDDSESYPVPTRPLGGLNGDKINLQAVDPDLYGLRRSKRSRDTRSSKSSSDDDADADGDDDEDYEDNKATKRKRANRAVTATKAKDTPEYNNSEGGSDSDYGAPSRKKKRMAATNEDFRFSSRGNRVPNYAENEDDEDASGDDDDMMDIDGVAHISAGPEEEVHEIEGVFDHHRDEERKEDLQDDFYTNIRFHVKWKGYSHLHNTDEMYIFLKNFKGIKRVDNYIRTQQQIAAEAAQAHAAGDLEEEETYNIMRSRQKENLELLKVVERIVAHRTRAEDGVVIPEYFCKWHSQNYDAATWEKYDEIKHLAREEIENFRKREQNEMFPYRSVQYSLHNRPKFESVKQDPSYIAATGQQLKDFQLTGLNWMNYLWSKGDNGVLADEMGLGKTVQSVAFLSYLFHERNSYGPFLVVVPLSTITAWQQQFTKWAPDMNVVCYLGSAPARVVIREYEWGTPKKLKFNVLLTTYEMVLKDLQEISQIKWQALLVDEAHRLKNSESQLYTALSSLMMQFKLLITGTPLQNNVKELLALMHFLMPNVFPLANDFDLNDPDQEAKIKELHNKLKEYMLRRLKTEVIQSLPTKTERILRVELSSMQAQLYKNILTRNYQALSKGGAANISLLNIAMECKKAANHPYLFDGVEPESVSKEEDFKQLVKNSGKLILLDKLLAKLKAEHHRVLIFSQMVRMLDLLSSYLRMRSYVFQRLDGNVGADQRKKAIEHFNAPGSPDFVFLLSTRAGGLGINLETADTVIIYDSDWNPQNDLQAMARAHRIGQKSHVNVYRLVSKDTMEEDVLERAKQKMVLEYAIINQMDTSQAHLSTTGKTEKEKKPSNQELSAILKYGAQNMFKTDDKELNKKLDEMDLDDILSRAEQHDTVVTDPAGQSLGGEGFLASLAEVTDVKTDINWDEIIPLDERQRIEREDAEKKAEQLAAETTQGRKRQAANVTYEGMDMMDPSVATAGDKKKKETKAPAPARKTAAAKSMELKDRDIRVLVRSLQRWGDVRTRYDEIVRDARLEGKNQGIIYEAADGLVELCEEAVSNHKAEIRQRVESGQQLTAAQKSKAVLVTFRGVQNINAETVVSRHHELKILHTYLSREADPYSWHLPVENVRPTLNWSSKWGSQEDAMLLVGAYIHGFGNWELMVADAKLALAGKVFLDEGKKTSAEGENSSKPIPNAIHLVRRGDYLLGMLREQQERARELREFEKKQKRRVSTPLSTSIPTPSKRSRENERDHEEEGRERKKRKKTPTFTDSEEEDDVIDEQTLKEELRSVKSSLMALKGSDKIQDREEKLSVLRTALTAIGERIAIVISDRKKRGEDAEKWRKALWEFVTLFWPLDVKADKLQSIHSKLVQQSGKKPTQTGGAPATPAQPNGHR